MGSIDDLERLAALHVQGALTDAEFATAKQGVIEYGPDEEAPVPESVDAHATSLSVSAHRRSRRRLLLAIGCAMVVLAAAIVVFVAHRSDPAGTASRPLASSRRSSVTTSAGSATAASSTADVSASFAVTSCPTEYGADGGPNPSVPGTISTTLPAEASSRLGFYSNGWLTVLAPKGWACSALMAADGGEYLSVYPPGEPDPAGYPPTDGLGVIAERDWLGHPPGASLVCAYFPGSEAEQIMSAVGGCGSLPAGVLVDHPTAELATFSTPDDEYGVVLYPQQVSDNVTLAKETCRLDPADAAALCSFITADFLDRHPTDGP